MGAIPMECPKCGNRDVNKILVHFTYGTKEQPIHDTTTLAKFLYSLEHPEDRRSLGINFPLVEVKGYSCDDNVVHVKEKWEINIKIPSRRYGV